MGQHQIVTVESGGLAKPRPGKRMAETIARLKADHDLRDAHIRATNQTPLRKSDKMRSIRSGRGDSWSPLLDGIDEMLHCAEFVGDPNTVWEITDEVLHIADVLRHYILDRRDEALARIARGQGPTPPVTRAALRRVA